MRSPRRLWIVFAAGALTVLLAVAWISGVVLRLERSELEARVEAEHQGNLRAALWRMDSWLSMFLGREAARPYTDYLPEERGPLITRAASPLRSLNSQYVPLHFQIDAVSISSPQLSDPTRQPMFDRLAGCLDLDRVRSDVLAAESLPTTKLATRVAQPSPEPASGSEYAAGGFCSVPPAPGEAWVNGVSVDVGPFVPLWLAADAGGTCDLALFVRRVSVGTGKLFQGFVVDWPRLHEQLLGEVADLFPDASLVRVRPGVELDRSGQYLANVPVALITSAAPRVAPSLSSPSRTILLLAWVLTLVATASVGLALHRSVQLGERRRRFVSAVTHELRTPLTTFKMYSEMLADGFVQDEKQRQQYHETLKDESVRLSSMVDNVLAHARLEGQRVPHRVEPITLAELLDRITPPLRRQVENSGLAFQLERNAPGSSPLAVDPESIGQVLRNLVDNAVKYGRNGSSSAVRIDAAVENGRLTLCVRDNGPGVSVERRRAIFRPFDRGERDSTDSSSGIGLGLSIARGLARDMRGDVTLDQQDGRGACFRLELPVTTPASRRS